MMKVALALAALVQLLSAEVSEDTRVKCHTGYRDEHGKFCHEYATRDMEAQDEYPELDPSCLTIKWEDADQDNNWGNCVEMRVDENYRYITSNNVPDYYFNPYCPIGLKYGYCVPQEYEAGTCMFKNLTCGKDNGAGSTPYGDVWVPVKSTYKIILKGNPTRSDRPGDMYDAETVGSAKSDGAAAAVAINGIGILGPNDAGDVSIDEAGFQLACGGHVTPPLSNYKPEPRPRPTGPPPTGPPPPQPDDGDGGPSGPPMYHYHKSPECLMPFRNASLGYDHGARPYEHAQMIGWAMDGFKVYAYQDIGGAAPVVDECGGHFGPTDTGEVEYHYHSRTITPYHLACQGPSLGKCKETQRGANFCHPGCGADICVQPGTDERKLRAYLAQWDPEWLDKYTVNDYKIRPKPGPRPPPRVSRN